MQLIYKTVKEIASIWGISERRVRVLCIEGRIEGVVKVGRSWNIPAEASKPIDYRNKKDINFIGIYDIDFSGVDMLNDELNSLKPLSENQLKMLKEDLNLRWTYNSNAIEGNTLTLKETKVALEGITVGGKSIKEHLEVINHKEAIDYFEEISVSKQPLTETIIKNIHYLILKQISSTDAGMYRKENVIISGAEHRPPQYIQLNNLMERLVYDYNNNYSNLHPIVSAALLHGEFVKIHPFVDGNGRAARILLNFSLMRDRYISIVITKEKRLEYYEALDKAHTTLDYSDFIKLIEKLLIDELKHRINILK